MIQEKIRQYNRMDKDYPVKLLDIKNSPSKLFVCGELPNPDKPAVAIVGARNATPYGYRTATEFAETLAANGVQIISGFARGIDRAAHEGAIKAGGRTFAILGNGIDICYPRENMDLYQQLEKYGGFISEFALTTPPKAQHFPARNRIISGLADVILVIEAREKSGSLITADFGLEQGKDIYAVPGRICDVFSSGCNRLIAQGAGIAISPYDMLKELEINVFHLKSFREKNKILLAQEEETVYSCIRLQPKNIEELLAETNYPLSKLTNILIQLELKNLIRELGRNNYIRT